METCIKIGKYIFYIVGETMNLKSIAHYVVIFGVVLLIITFGNFSGEQSAWASNGAQACVPGTIPCPTPTPAPPTPTPKPSGGGGGSQPATMGSIAGQVIDLSTGLPGVGVTVRINDVDIVTDKDGRYSLSGLNADEYLVSLVLTGDAVSAQEPVNVHIAGNDVSLDLRYYSVPPVGGVVTTTAIITTTGALPAPAFLPETGGLLSTWGIVIVGLGILIFGASQVYWVKK